MNSLRLAIHFCGDLVHYRERAGFLSHHAKATSRVACPLAEYTFIQTRFHPMTLSSNDDFIQ